jgi:hypothetical protein
MLREAYPGAIYYYMGRPYRITRVYPRDGQLSAIRSKSWVTKPLANTMVFPRFGEAMIGLSGKPDAFVVHGELQVSEKVAEAEGMNDLAEQLHSLATVCGQMRKVPLSDGRPVETMTAPENWMEVIGGGEPGIYVSKDGSHEVMVLGYRFTPSGLMYELKPKNEKGSAKWMRTRLCLIYLREQWYRTHDQSGCRHDVLCLLAS